MSGRRFREVFSLWYFLVGLVIAGVVALALRAFSGLSFWTCFAIAVGSLLLNGWLMARKDDSP